MPAQGRDEIFGVGHEPCYFSRVQPGGHGAHAHLMQEAGCMRSCGVQLRVLEVDVLRVRPEGDNEGLREHPEHVHASHQVAVLERAGAIRQEVIGMQAACNASANQLAMNSTHDGKR